MYGLKTVKVGVCDLGTPVKTAAERTVGRLRGLRVVPPRRPPRNPCGGRRLKANGRRCRKKNGICVVAASCVSLGKLTWELKPVKRRRHVWWNSTNRSVYDACAVLAHIRRAGPENVRNRRRGFC